MAAFTLPHFSNYTMVICDFNNELSQTNFVTYSTGLSAFQLLRVPLYK